MYTKYSKPAGMNVSARLRGDLIITEDQKYFLEQYCKQPPRSQCRICNQEIGDSRYDYEASGVPFIICPRCNHHNGAFDDDSQFNESFFSSKEIAYAKHYTEEFYQRVFEIYMPKLEFLLDIARRESVEVSGICDFGAGIGHFLKCCKDRGIPSRGYEISSHMIELAEVINPMAEILGDWDNCLRRSFVDDSFNIVSLIFSLEHVPDPMATLVSIASYEPELIYVSVPHVSSDLLTDALIPDYFSRQVAGAHTNIFTTESLDYAMECVGYKPSGRWYFGRNAFRLCSKLADMALASGKYSSIGLKSLKNALYSNIDDLQYYFDRLEKSDEIHAVFKRIV